MASLAWSYCSLIIRASQRCPGNQDDSAKGDDDKAKEPAGPSDSSGIAPVRSSGAAPTSTLHLGSLGPFSAPPRLRGACPGSVDPVVPFCASAVLELGDTEVQVALPTSPTSPMTTWMELRLWLWLEVTGRRPGPLRC